MSNVEDPVSKNYVSGYAVQFVMIACGKFYCFVCECIVLVNLYYCYFPFPTSLFTF